MLNYISAELYKLHFHKGLYIGTGLLLLLESLVFLPGFMTREEKDYLSLDVLLGFLAIAMTVGIMIAPIFAVMAFDNQHGNGTLKNEIVFGVSRSLAYQGKMLTGALAGTGIAVLAILFYLLLTVLVGGESQKTIDWDWYASIIVAQWLVWLTVYAVAFLLLTLFGSPAIAIALTYMAILMTPIVVGIVWCSDLGFGWQLAASLSFGAPMALLMVSGDATVQGVILPLLGGNTRLYTLFICILWWGISTAVGVLTLRRREIK